MTDDPQTTETERASTPEGIEVVRGFVESVARGLDIQREVVAERNGDELNIGVRGDELGLLIGRHGQTLEALQHLAQRIALDNGVQLRVVVDAEGYRERRREAIEAQVLRLAERARTRGEALPLEAMTSSERRYVHEMVRDLPGVESYSEGDEPDRKAIIAPEGSGPGSPEA